jgi:acylglycerol lipase
MDSTSPQRRLCRRDALMLGLAAALSGCASVSVAPGPRIESPRIRGDDFTMGDGAELPYRAWMPAGNPSAVILALHGFNDSRDAFEIPGPSFVDAGVAMYAPDQRGFGAAPGRGYWPGVQALIDDARSMARILRARYPSAPLYVLGESMGGAVAMGLATSPNPPDVAGYVMAAPAVWGRASMDVFLRSALWLAYNFVPGMTATHAPGVTVIASDNREALIRLSRDPLTIHETRIDTLKGLVDLMDVSLEASATFRAPGLFLYGGKDDLVPAEATAATWHRLPNAGQPGGSRLAFYPKGHHLLLRDLDRTVEIGDILAWMRAPTQPLPSGADQAAKAWLATQA